MRLYGKSIAVCALLLAFGSSSAQAAIITLFNTGVNSAGVSLPNGSAEIHYSLIAPVPAGSTTSLEVVTSAGGFPIPPWLGDSTISAWISPANRNGIDPDDDPAGTYTYRTTFTLPAFTTASITGQWATDNTGGSILLNGVATANPPSPGFTSFTSFTISSGFVTGTNTLDFVVTNLPATSTNPTGLRVELTGQFAPVPEPTTICTWLGVALIFSAGCHRRRRRLV